MRRDRGGLAVVGARCLVGPHVFQQRSAGVDGVDHGLDGAGIGEQDVAEGLQDGEVHQPAGANGLDTGRDVALVNGDEPGYLPLHRFFEDNVRGVEAPLRPGLGQVLDLDGQSGPLGHMTVPGRQAGERANRYVARALAVVVVVRAVVVVVEDEDVVGRAVAGFFEWPQPPNKARVTEAA